jgi:hypothetical protein
MKISIVVRSFRSFLARERQLCELSLIYGRFFEALFTEPMERGQDKLRQQLPSLPAISHPRVHTLNRENTLRRMERRVNSSVPSPYAVA